eukprot:m.23521 g.23521  ORF g.23521 m.23521 type:complete len:279 (+) comp12953_c0_seq4:242-1078(+)
MVHSAVQFDTFKKYGVLILIQAVSQLTHAGCAYRVARSPLACLEGNYLNTTTSECLPCNAQCSTSGCVGPDASDCISIEDGEGDPSTGIIVFGAGFLLMCCMIAFIMSWCLNQRTTCAPKADAHPTLSMEHVAAVDKAKSNAASRANSVDLDNELLSLASRSARRTPSIQAKDARAAGAGRGMPLVAQTPSMSPIEENVTSAILQSREKFQARRLAGLQSLDTTPLPTPTDTPPNWADGHGPTHPSSALSTTTLRSAQVVIPRVETDVSSHAPAETEV